MENQENQEKKHKRRVRYSGTHPRNYKEKYKELNPEKVCRYYFKGDPKKAEHRQECTFPSVYRRSWTSFDIQPGQQGLDATLGYGGHTSKMLEKLQERAISTDWM